MKRQEADADGGNERPLVHYRQNFAVSAEIDGKNDAVG